MSKKDTREIVGQVGFYKNGEKRFKRGCNNFNHREAVQIFIYNENPRDPCDGRWTSVCEFPLGCCLNQDHPNFKKPCIHFKLKKEKKNVG